MLIPQMMGPLAKWTQEAVAVVTGSSEPFSLGWTPPRWEMLDPAAEVEASSAAIRNGLSWRSQELRANGMDPDEWLRGMVEDNKLLDDNEIILDSDPRTTTLRGASQPEPARPGRSSAP